MTALKAIAFLLCALIGACTARDAVMEGAPTAKPEPPTSQPTSQIGVASFSDHDVTGIRLGGRGAKPDFVVGMCPAKGSLSPRDVPIQASDYLSVSYSDEQGRRHTAAFTRPIFSESMVSQTTYTLFFGSRHQLLLRASVQGDFKLLGEWYVPDAERTRVHPRRAMTRPRLVGVGPRDPYFDTAEALVRYPLYDQVDLYRAGDIIGGGVIYDSARKRELPGSKGFKVERVWSDRLVLISEDATERIEVGLETDAPLSADEEGPEQPPPTTRHEPAPDFVQPPRTVKPAESGQQESPPQGIDVSNFGERAVRDLVFEAGGEKWQWFARPGVELRPGGVSSGYYPVPMNIQGKVHVSYTDGNGRHRAADFERVPSGGGQTFPHRRFYFDSHYNVLLETFDLDAPEENVRWFVPVDKGDPHRKVAVPELLATAFQSGIGGGYTALIRYPFYDAIGEYRDGQMLGGSATDYVSHETRDGIPRYRIEAVETGRMVLVRAGKRISVPLQ